MSDPRTIFQDAQVVTRDERVFVIISYQQVWELAKGDDPTAAMDEIKRFASETLR